MTASPLPARWPRVVVAGVVFTLLALVLPLLLPSLVDRLLFSSSPSTTDMGTALGQAFATLAVAALASLVLAWLVGWWAGRFAGLRRWWAPLALLLTVVGAWLLSSAGLTMWPALASPLLAALVAMPLDARGRDRFAVGVAALLAGVVLLTAGMVQARVEHRRTVRELESYGVQFMAPSGREGQATSAFRSQDGTVVYTWWEGNTIVAEVRLTRTGQPDQDASVTREEPMTVRCVRDGMRIDVVQDGETAATLTQLCQAMRPVSADWMASSQQKR